MPNQRTKLEKRVTGGILVSMRKRLVIGGLGIIAVGVLVLMLSGPKKGSLEWHKRQYVDVRTRLYTPTRFERLEDRLLPNRAQARYDVLTREELLHQRALLDMGFLVTRRIPSNWAIYLSEAEMLSSKEAVQGHARGEITFAGSDVFIEVSVPPADMAKWERMLGF